MTDLPGGFARFLLDGRHDVAADVLHRHVQWRVLARDQRPLPIHQAYSAPSRTLLHSAEPWLMRLACVAREIFAGA